MTTYAANRILANNRNLIREAVLSASAQRPSADIRLTAQSRQGRGQMRLSGPYTGADDTLVEVEVLDGAGATLRATTPVVTGVGNGALTVTGVDAGAVAETLTFTLADAGDPATFAELPFYGVTLRAKVAGAASNALTLTVTRHLVFTDLPYATLSEITAGTVDFEGTQWDFGAVSATGSTIPAGAPRLAFEGFPQVHRHWRVWSSGRWIYHLDPAPEYAVPADTQVLGVSGDYTLTLTDGVATEVYAAVTNYDFLSAVQARSALIEVVGVVVADTAPGGQGITDIPLRSDAHLLPVTASIASRYGSRTLADLALRDPDAGTENIRVICRGGLPAVWSVEGGVSGVLPDAVTGTHYGFGPVAFTIPEITLPTDQLASIYAKIDLAAREDGETVPAVCLDPLARGAQASAKTLTFTYTARPPMTCDCKNAPAIRLNDGCLGLDLGGTSMALDPEYQSRLQALYTWRATFMRAQVDLAHLAGIKLAKTDMDYCDAAVTSFADTLAQVYEVPAALTEWGAALTQLQTDFNPFGGGANLPVTGQITTAALGQIVAHPDNGHLYRLERVEKYYVDGAGEEVADGSQTQVSRLPVLDGWSTSGGSFTIETPMADIFERTYWTDLGAAVDLVGPASALDVAQLVRRYTARMDYVLTLAGIVPKSDASTGGDGCWRDTGDAYWWVESTGRYLPAFTNEPYYSCVTDADGAAQSTQEFGFGIRVDCAGALKAGDQFTLTLSGAATGAYAEGDSYTIPIVGGGPALFAGGEDGDATQTWAVSGSVGGAYADWAWDPGAPGAYTAGPVDATLAAGGILFEEGDQIGLAIEGGQLRWRRDGGAWSTVDLFGATHDLGDGLALMAVPGAAPSFLAGDSWAFSVAATYGVDRLRQPRESQAFAWDGAEVALEVDLGSARPLEMVLIALHSLPATVGLTLSGGIAADDEWVLSPLWREGPILVMVPGGTVARYLTLRVNGAGSGAAIGWLWAGVPWAPTTGASSMQHVRQYGLSRTGGRNPSALYRGRGTGGRWGWSLDAQAALLSADVAGLWSLLDHIAEQGLEWVCLVPDIADPTSATLAQIDADEAVLTEQLGYRYDGQSLFDVELPFRAVLR